MDPQQLNTLDPKLREAYDRIMGTATKPSIATAAQTPAVPSHNPIGPTQPNGDALTSEKRPIIPDLTVAPKNNTAATAAQMFTQDMPKPHVTPPPAVAQPKPVSPPPIPALSTPPAPVQMTPPPPVQQPVTQSIPPVMSQPKQTLPETPLSQPSASAFDSVVANNQMHAYVAQEVAGAKQSIKMIQLMYVIGGIVFFVVYALFWIKFFNIATPF